MHPHIPARKLLTPTLCLLATLPATTARAAVSLYTSVQAQAYAGPDGGGPGAYDGRSDYFTGGPSNSSSISAEFSRTDVLSPAEDRSVQQPVTWDAKVTEVSNASAGYGQLHAYSAISASSIPYSVTLEGYDRNGDPYADTFLTPAGAGGDATVLARSSDTLTVTSPSLPTGSPVSLRITLSLDGAISTSAPATVGNITFTPTGYASAGFSPGSDGVFFPGHTLHLGDPTFTETIQVHVGDTLTPSVSLNASANVTEAVSSNGSIIIDPGGSVVVDASDTASFYIDPLTPAVSLVAESGHDYTTPLPEPAATLPLLALAAATHLRRRRTHPARH